MDVTIGRIAQSAQDGQAAVEFIFPRALAEANLPLSDGSWTVAIQKDERFFEVLLK